MAEPNTASSDATTITDAAPEVAAAPKVKAFAYDTWLYHAEKAPAGKLFSEGASHPGKGWVDTPAGWSEEPEPAADA